MKSNRNTGFTLIEIAIVLIIIALLGIGAMVALRAQSQRTQLIETQAALEDAKEALLNYASVNNPPRLPCPAIEENPAQPDNPIYGIEQPPCTNGKTTIGTIPWKTLGIDAKDAWGRHLHYIVSNTYTNQVTSLSTPGAVNVYINGILQNNTSDTAIAFALWSTGETTDNNTITPQQANSITIAGDRSNSVTWVSRYIVLGRMLEAGKTLQQ